MVPIVLFALATAFGAQADTCKPLTVQRIASAESLMQRSLTAEAIDRASMVERSRILLERSLDDDPACRAVKSAHRCASRMLKAAEPISQAASLDDALMHALERVEALEQAEEPERDEIEVLRFMLAELGRHYPDDERVDALVRRTLVVQRGER